MSSDPLLSEAKNDEEADAVTQPPPPLVRTSWSDGTTQKQTQPKALRRGSNPEIYSIATPTPSGEMDERKQERPRIDSTDTFPSVKEEEEYATVSNQASRHRRLTDESVYSVQAYDDSMQEEEESATEANADRRLQALSQGLSRCYSAPPQESRYRGVTDESVYSVESDNSGNLSAETQNLRKFKQECESLDVDKVPSSSSRRSSLPMQLARSLSLPSTPTSDKSPVLRKNSAKASILQCERGHNFEMVAVKRLQQQPRAANSCCVSCKMELKEVMAWHSPNCTDHQHCNQNCENNSHKPKCQEKNYMCKRCHRNAEDIQRREWFKKMQREQQETMRKGKWKCEKGHDFAKEKTSSQRSRCDACQKVIPKGDWVWRCSHQSWRHADYEQNGWSEKCQEKNNICNACHEKEKDNYFRMQKKTLALVNDKTIDNECDVVNNDDSERDLEAMEEFRKFQQREEEQLAINHYMKSYKGSDCAARDRALSAIEMSAMRVEGWANHPAEFEAKVRCVDKHRFAKVTLESDDRCSECKTKIAAGVAHWHCEVLRWRSEKYKEVCTWNDAVGNCHRCRSGCLCDVCFQKKKANLETATSKKDASIARWCIAMMLILVLVLSPGLWSICAAMLGFHSINEKVFFTCFGIKFKGFGWPYYVAFMFYKISDVVLGILRGSAEIEAGSRVCRILFRPAIQDCLLRRLPPCTRKFQFRMLYAKLGFKFVKIASDMSTFLRFAHYKDFNRRVQFVWFVSMAISWICIIFYLLPDYRCSRFDYFQLLLGLSVRDLLQLSVYLETLSTHLEISIGFSFIFTLLGLFDDMPLLCRRLTTLKNPQGSGSSSLTSTIRESELETTLAKAAQCVCGKSLDEDANFCKRCGKSVQASKFDFNVDDEVSTKTDADVPSGSDGVVIGFIDDKVHVKFPKGRLSLLPSELEPKAMHAARRVRTVSFE